MTVSLLDGPDPRLGAEPFAAHQRRLGLPLHIGGALISAIDGGGLRGHGGAGFPTAVKWRGVAAGSHGDAVVLANGAEGEPLSSKDRVLMETRPHLVLDGLELAAAAVHAREAVLYIGGAHVAAAASLRAALHERRTTASVRMVSAPPRYVAGEESAAVHCVNDGVALPTSSPLRPHQRGVNGRPTLVNNVETLARVALLARGIDAGRGSLATVSGAVRTPGVVEVSNGMTVGQAVERAGQATSTPSAVLLGGYFGRWMDASAAWRLPLDPDAMRAAGVGLGCGVVSVLAEGECGVARTATFVTYLAAESAGQCGPCVFGLAAIAAAVTRIQHRVAHPQDLERIGRWTGELPGRGACRHPDGAAALLGSAMRVFADDFAAHTHERRCAMTARTLAA